MILRRGDQRGENAILSALVEMQYERNDYELKPGRVPRAGDAVEVLPAYEEKAIRISMFWATRSSCITVGRPAYG